MNWTKEVTIIPNVSHSNRDLPLYTENYPWYIKLFFFCVGTVAVVSSITAIIVLRRTRRIPHAAKFLATGLLTFDLLYISLITVRKFVLNPLINTSINVLSTTVLQLAYVTVALMSVERFIMFYHPMRYMEMCTEQVVKFTSFTVWTFTVIIFQTVRYAACYMVFESYLIFEEAGRCNQIVTIYYSALVIAVLVTSTVCYWNIFNIVKMQLTNSEKKTASFASAASVLRTYKSTFLVLLYLLVILCLSATYTVIIVFIRVMDLDVGTVRLSLDTVSTVNCIIDPFLYVLWFKESQMEMYRLFSRFSKRLKRKAEDMKYDIFNIVTTNPAMCHRDT